MHSWLNKPLIAAILLTSTLAQHMYSAPTVPVAVGYKAAKEMSEQERLAEAEQLFMDLFDASKPTASNPHLEITAFLNRIIELLKDIPKYSPLCTKLNQLKSQFRDTKWYGNVVSWVSPTRGKSWDAKGKAVDLGNSLKNDAHLLSPKTKAFMDAKLQQEGQTKLIETLADRIENCRVVRKVIKI